MSAPASGRVARRLVEYALTLWVALTLNFFLPHLMPGEPLTLLAGSGVQSMGAERIAALRAHYGLDQPLATQYARYLGRLAQGDLGQSYRFSGGRSVAELLADRFGWTLLLVGSSLLIATVIGSLLGAWAAWRHGSLPDLGLLASLFTLRAMPAFWLAMILIPLFSLRLDWLPVGGSYSFPRPAGVARWTDVLHHAVLPVAVLTLVYVPAVFAVMRSAMIGIRHADFIQLARAKGLAERTVVRRHAMRNAWLPVLTMVALDMGQLLGGVVLIETVFDYRGLGTLMFEAVKSRDYPLLQGGFLLFTVGVLTLNLVADGLYRWLDPRTGRAG